MFFKTYRDNTQRGRVLHYLRIKALEKVLDEGDNFHKKLESGEIRFGQDQQDVPFIDARAAARGLELLRNKVIFSEDVRPASEKMLMRHLDWFLQKLTSAELYAKNHQNQQDQAAQFAAAAQFVYELLHPIVKPDLSLFKNIPEWDGESATG
jgi:hypothetical protein